MLEYLKILVKIDQILGAMLVIAGGSAIPLVLHLWGTIAARQLAKDTGAFKAGELLIGLYGVPVVHGSELRLVIAIPKKQYSGHFMYLQVALANTGTKNLQDVSVRFKFPHRSVQFMEKKHFSVSHPFFDDEFTMKEHSTDEERTHAVRLAQIQPKVQVSVAVPVKLFESFVETTIELPTAKDKFATQRVRVRLVFFMDITAMSADAVPITFCLSTEVYRAESLQQLEHDYISYLTTKRKQDPLDHTRLTNCLFIMPKYVEHESSNKRVLLECLTKDVERSFKIIKEDGNRVTSKSQ